MTYPEPTAANHSLLGKPLAQGTPILPLALRLSSPRPVELLVLVLQSPSSELEVAGRKRPDRSSLRFSSPLFPSRPRVAVAGRNKTAAGPHRASPAAAAQAAAAAAPGPPPECLHHLCLCSRYCSLKAKT